MKENIIFKIIMEEELRGGKSTPNVVKVGNTVRRPSKESSIFVSEILKYLEKYGCPYTQRFLRFDDENREVYEYIEGVVPTDVGDTTIEQLEMFMKMLKNIHDITEKLTNDGKVICHHDLSPCNVVFRGGIPIAIIDWDCCSYGERWEDVTYSIWSWANIGNHQRDTKILLDHMQKALDAYGADIEMKSDFAEKLLWKMDKRLEDTKKINLEYIKIKEWVEFSKLWVIENKIKIKELIG